MDFLSQNAFIKSFIIMFFSFFISKIIKRLISNYVKKSKNNKRADTLMLIFGKIVTYIIYFFASSELLQNLFNIKTTTIITATGVVGVAVGLGAQSLVKDVIYGFFTIFENQYAVGEIITIGNFTGKVMEMGIRLTKLKNSSGDFLMIPNSQIEKVINHSREIKKTIIYINISHKQDINLALETLEDVAKNAKKDIEEIIYEPNVLGISKIGFLGITLKILVKCSYENYDHVESEILKKIKTEFDNKKILFCFKD